MSRVKPALGVSKRQRPDSQIVPDYRWWSSQLYL
jgi:hypothetical protein